jgi:ketosteroid isomerase-like protein
VADEAAVEPTSRTGGRGAGRTWQVVSFYADDAVVMLEDAPDFTSPQVIRERLGGMMQDPNFALSFEADKVTVARSGDIAYETGSYALTLTGPDKKPAVEDGHYVVVWKKGEDGTWKVAVDAPISDPPPAPGAKP